MLNFVHFHAILVLFRPYSAIAYDMDIISKIVYFGTFWLIWTDFDTIFKFLDDYTHYECFQK